MIPLVRMIGEDSVPIVAVGIALICGLFSVAVAAYLVFGRYRLAPSISILSRDTAHTTTKVDTGG